MDNQKKQAIIKKLDELGFIEACIRRHRTPADMTRIGIMLWAGEWALEGIQASTNQIEQPNLDLDGHQNATNLPSLSNLATTSGTANLDLARLDITTKPSQTGRLSSLFVENFDDQVLGTKDSQEDFGGGLKMFRTEDKATSADQVVLSIAQNANSNFASNDENSKNKEKNKLENNLRMEEELSNGSFLAKSTGLVSKEPCLTGQMSSVQNEETKKEELFQRTHELHTNPAPRSSKNSPALQSIKEKEKLGPHTSSSSSSNSSRSSSSSSSSSSGSSCSGTSDSSSSEISVVVLSSDDEKAPLVIPNEKEPVLKLASTQMGNIETKGTLSLPIPRKILGNKRQRKRESDEVAASAQKKPLSGNTENTNTEIDHPTIMGRDNSGRWFCKIFRAFLTQDQTEVDRHIQEHINEASFTTEKPSEQKKLKKKKQ